MVDENLMNVLEPMTLYDTVLIGDYVDSMKFNDGWFATFAALGAANEIPFFNVRNRNHHLAYNNQDSRDQTAYGMQIYSMGVTFFGPAVATQFQDVEGTMSYAEEIHSATWEADIPQHASATLRINQDDRLKINCAMAPPGYGPSGGGMGHGDPTVPTFGETTTAAIMKGMTSMGVPEVNNQWPFPVPLDVPRRASISVVIKLSEYARQMLQIMDGPLSFAICNNSDGEYGQLVSCMYGIQVSMKVKRYVQQRAQYSA
jgi:hypothetical protein